MEEEETITQRAITSALRGESAFCKFLWADEIEQAYQNGIFAPKSALKMLLNTDIRCRKNMSRVANVKWQGNIILKNEFTYDGRANGELHIKGFRHDFTLLSEDNIGSLLVFVRNDAENYEAWVLDDSDKIDEFLGIFGMSPVDTDDMIR